MRKTKQKGVLRLSDKQTKVPSSPHLRMIRRSAMHLLLRSRRLLRWCTLGLFIGLILGLIGTAFVFCVQYATSLRMNHPWLLLLLPAAGILIVWLYRVTKNHDDRGTNMVLASIRSETELPAQMAPLIFICTIITHLCGGSAGREGAALQLGGSIANSLGGLLHLNRRDMRLLILAGMSAAFSAIFGTPIAAAIFAMEVSCIGIMRYSALVPCTVASLTASFTAHWLHNEPEHYKIEQMAELTPVNALRILLLGILCAFVSIIFCKAMHRSEHLLERRFRNPYLRILVTAAVLLLLGLLLQSTDYYGTGSHIIEQAIGGEVVWYAFLAKILFTAITIGGGFKGGEIVPTFFIGATFGCLFGQITGFSPSLCAAVGMIALFCSVTNCPLASLFIAAELFGLESLPFCLLAIAVSYLLSGYHGLYKEQRFLYSKYADSRIHHKTKH